MDYFHLKTSIFSGFYQFILKPFLFFYDPEKVHDKTTEFGKFLGEHTITKSLTRALFSYQSTFLSQKIHGIAFNNPIGLSAGFDKDANLVDILPSVGFGYMQIGSITNKPYRGNSGKRLYRLPKSRALVVYYGLKNIGVNKILAKLKNKKLDFPVSISIAKTNSKSTNTNTKGIKDYEDCLSKVISSDVGDFYTINISCPNTFGGEPFTTPKKLDNLLGKLNKLKPQKPMFIKMPINNTLEEFDKLLKICIKHSVNGVIIGNLNKNHKDSAVVDKIPKDIKGGISGYPTWKLSNALISYTYKKYADRLTIIGVGGVFSASDAYAKIKSGASLVQLITGMIYVGPQLVGQINYELERFAKRDGYANISEAIGATYKTN